MVQGSGILLLGDRVSDFSFRPSAFRFHFSVFFSRVSGFSFRVSFLEFRVCAHHELPRKVGLVRRAIRAVRVVLCKGLRVEGGVLRVGY